MNIKKRHRSGFTLLELLATIMIVGALAAIALPQYTKSVERTRVPEALGVLATMANAMDMYRTQHGTFPKSLDALDVEPPKSPNFTYSLAVGGVFANRFTSPTTRQYFLVSYAEGWTGSTSFTPIADNPPITYCYGDTDKGKALCKSLGWKTRSEMLAADPASYKWKVTLADTAYIMP